MSKMNKGYLAKVDNIQDEAMDKDSKKLFPQFINLGSKASSLIDIVKGEESKRRPSVLNNIFGAIKNIYYTLKNQQALALGT